LALADFTHALAARPGYARAYYQRHLLYVSLGENEKAVADLLAHDRCCEDRRRRTETLTSDVDAGSNSESA
jgi:hypothetical protein